MKKNVVFVSAEYPPVVGGVSVFARNLAEGIARCGHKVRVITTGGPRPARDDDGTAVRRLRTYLPGRLGSVVALALAMLAEVSRRPESILICGRLSHEGPGAFLSRWIFGTPYAIVAHGSEILQYRRTLIPRFVVTILLRSARHVVANSSYTQGLVQSFGVDASRITVIHPPLDPRDYAVPTPDAIAEVRARFRLEGQRVLLTVGQITRRKGHDTVLRALQRIVKDGAAIRYVIVGGTGEARDKIERLVEDLQLEGHVVFAGHASPSDVRALYALCDVYVMPCRELDGDVEGFGIAFAEAGLFGKPVIGGQGGGTADVVVHDETGLLIAPDDVDALELAILRLLRDQDLASRLGEAGRRRAEERFTIDAQLARIDAVMSTLERPVARREQGTVA